VLRGLTYRCWQVGQQLGFAAPLSERERQEVADQLSTSALCLFECMSAADQRHSLRVCRGLQERDYRAQDLLVAALLHDVGKAGGRAPFWTRPLIVLGKRCSPRLLNRLAVYPDRPQRLLHWRSILGSAWWHAEIGADMAARAGLSERTVHYIRMHHRPDSPELTELHLVDEVS
jgi:hypothetical protein